MNQNIQISLPEHNIETAFLIDFEDKETVEQALELSLQWVKDYIANNNIAYWSGKNQKLEPCFLQKDPNTEAFPYKKWDMDLFDGILERHPDLEAKLVEWADYILSLDYGILVCDNKYYGHEIFDTLAYHDKKYIRHLIRFLRLNDMDHEDETQLFILDTPIDKFGICDEVLELVAARFCSLCGQHGQELDFPFEELTEAQQNTYLKCLLTDINDLCHFSVKDRIEVWLMPAIEIAFDMELEDTDEPHSKTFNERLPTIVKATADYEEGRYKLGDTKEERLAKIERNFAKIPTLAQLQDSDFIMPEFEEIKVA